MSKKTHRYFPLLADITVTLEDGSSTKDVSNAEFINDTVLKDRRFGLGRDEMKEADEIEAAVLEAAEGDGVVKLRDVLWEKLSTCAKRPQFGREGAGYIPHIGRQLLPFIDALCEATTEPPSAELAEAPAADAIPPEEPPA